MAINDEHSDDEHNTENSDTAEDSQPEISTEGDGIRRYTPLPLPPGIGEVKQIDLEEDLKSSYLDYAMSVIVSRALPDVRDGLKPVHRRILYAMHEGGYEAGKPYRKSARIVGDVIGKYHPHSNDPIYEALVRMAQPFSLLMPLLDGQGNFGSVDGDPPAAMRYTEIRLAKIANALLEDINRDTVDFQPNYDASEHEPSVLPARLPNLLVNGSGGIAVGMATNIPPHNLGEILDACCALIADPSIGDAELFNYVPGPDFPTYGIILGTSGIRSAYETGRGRIVLRGRVSNERVSRDREALIITEIPYQVNKARMIERIATLAREKRIEGISDLRDESDRQGMRVVVELKRDAVAEVVQNQLFQYSELQSSFSCNFVALHNGRPRVFDLRHMLTAFIDFREVVVTRRIKFLLRKARDRAHLIAGLSVAVANIDEVIRIIRHAPNPAAAREQLLAKLWPAGDVEPLLALIDDSRHKMRNDGRFQMSREQVKAILDLRLHRLTALGRDEIGEEMAKLAAEIAEFLEILRSREKVMGIVRDELQQLHRDFAQPRRTEIIIDDTEGEVDIESLIQREEMVVTVSRLSYIKRVPLSTYRAQRRGGKGRAAMSTREEDCVTTMFAASTHAPVLFFASGGKAYRLKVWRLPAAQPQARGKPLINLLPLAQGERVTSILPMPEEPEGGDGQFLIFATRSGFVRRSRIADFESINRSGKIAMRLVDDEIVDVLICRAEDDVLLTTAKGRCVRFTVSGLRVFEGRSSRGVRGIKLRGDDRLISMCLLQHVAASVDERQSYLRQAGIARRSISDDSDLNDEEPSEQSEVVLPNSKYLELGTQEQFVLTVAENGFGKRTSAYEYRTSSRGIQGVSAMKVNDRNGHLVAAFPVDNDDQIMLVTDQGRLIRCPIKDVRISSRSTQGVRLFDVDGDEKIVAVERLEDTEDSVNEE